MIETYLAGLGYETLVTTDPSEALSMLAERTVHAVVSDLQMPGTNGLELASLIKQRHPDTPTFILSLSARPPECSTAAIDGWFLKNKPLSVLRDALIQRLGNTWNLTRLRPFTTASTEPPS